MNILNSDLGKKSIYPNEYDPTLLFPIKRKIKQDKNNITVEFQGVDIWTSFEISWLDKRGKPEVRIAHFEIDAHSENIVESKIIGCS